MFSPGTTGARGLRLYQLGSFTVVGCRPEMAAGPRGQRSLFDGCRSSWPRPASRRGGTRPASPAVVP